jgi:acetyl-CoA C-acetyltransferase
MPFNAYIVGGARSAVGKRNGALSKWHPADLGAAVVDEVVNRVGVPPEAVDDVICGCVMQVKQNICRGHLLSLSSRRPFPHLYFLPGGNLELLFLFFSFALSER